MPRGKASANLSIADLEKMLIKRRSEIGGLEKKRDKLAAKLAKVEARISGLGGSAAPVVQGKRAKNSQSLVEVMLGVLKSGAAMKVADIAASAKKAGYKSNSENFRSIVNQTLIKDKRFTSSGERGMYQLRK